MTAYALGVDLGTTYSAAAVGRGGRADVVQLGAEVSVVPSVVVIRDDGEVLVGDAAERRASAEPARSAREFKRRLGDPVPLIVGDEPYSVEALMGHQLRAIVARASEQQGEAPSVVVLTHPANYTEFKLGKLREAAALAGLDTDAVILISEPEAAAIAYTRDQPVQVGEVIAVYDFGGGTFDAALVRRTASGFELVGIPEGMERLGGIDFDQAVLAHVDGAVGGLVTGADRADPQTLPAQARLRVECRRAKEALSTDSDTTIAVALPGLQTEVRLTRAEFEAMVRPRIAQTVTALERTVASAGLTIDDVTRVLLVGGTSRMPVVAEMIRSATGRPVGLDAHPKLAIATGAALAGASSIAAPAAAPAAEWQTPTRVLPAAPPEPAARSGPGGKKVALIAVAAAAVGLVGVLAFTALSGGDDDAAPVTDPGAVPVVTPVSPAAGPESVPAAEQTVPATGPAATEPVATESAPPEPVGGTVDELATLATGVIALTLDDGSVVAVLDDSSVVTVAADGTVATVGTASGPPGAVAVSPDGDIVVSTPSGVERVSDGSLVLDAAAVGVGTSAGPIAFDGVGNLYVADNDNARVIRQATDGSLSLIAGNGTRAEPGPPVEGTAIDLALGPVTGLAIDGAGRLLIADSAAAAVRAVVADGAISTVLGGGGTVIQATVGPVATAATDIGLAGVSGLAVDGAGAFAVTDDGAGLVIVVESNGAISVAIARDAGREPADGVPASESSVGTIGPVGLDRSGAVVFSDGTTLRRIS